MSDTWRDDPWIQQQYEWLTGRNPKTKRPWLVLRIPWFREGRRATTAYQRELARLTGNDSAKQFRLALLAAWAGDYGRAAKHVDNAFTLGLVHEAQTGDALDASKAARLRHLLRKETSYEGI